MGGLLSPFSPTDIHGIRRQTNVAFNRAAFRYNATIYYSSHQFVAIGSMDFVCPHCKALKYRKETSGLCCANGKVKLTPLVPPPEPLRSLVSGAVADSSHFLTHIQKYNNCFQMTSLGATYVVRDNFMPTFKVITTQSSFTQQKYHSTLLNFADSRSNISWSRFAIASDGCRL